MKMRVARWVGPGGAVRPPGDIWTMPRDIAVIYRETPPEYRYAVGYNHGKLVVLDLYNTNLRSDAPFLVPSFIEKFEDIDHAIAVLTISYQTNLQMENLRRVGQFVASAQDVGYSKVEGVKPLLNLPPKEE